MNHNNRSEYLSNLMLDPKASDLDSVQSLLDYLMEESKLIAEFKKEGYSE